MEGVCLIGRLTKCRYCRYVAPKGHCHGIHCLAFDGYNFGCVIASDMIYDFRDGFLGSMAWQTFFGFLNLRCTLGPPSEYS